MSIFTEARELKNKGNETKAVSMFEKGFAGGNPMCGYGLAVCCKYGDGIEKDEGKAEKLFISSLPKIRALAENGDPEAETVIGFYYYNGFTVETDEAEAFAWFQKAAEQGYTSAQNSLAWCYENGKGVEQDYEKAVYWYTQAAEQGYASAQNNLAWCYENGEGVEQDYEKAV